MLLDDNEWDLVRCLVTDHFTGTPDPCRMLERYFPGEVTDWPFSEDPARYAATVVESAQMASLSDPHPLSIRLLQALLSIPAIKVSVQQPQVKGFLDRLLSAKELLDVFDPFRALILPGTGESFIDRAQTRALLALLEHPTRPSPSRSPCGWSVRRIAARPTLSPSSFTSPRPAGSPRSALC